MRMLQEGQDAHADVEVTWSDQNSINSFSKLNGRLAELEERLETARKDEEYLVDACAELDLEDDDDQIRYRIGDAFVVVTVGDAKERLAVESARVAEELRTLQSTVTSVEAEMATLKTVLYKKFGSSINLEKPQ